MKYSYEYKRKCVKLYKQGKRPKTPEGLSDGEFQRAIRTWVRMEEAQGPNALRHKKQSKFWSPEDKLELVSKVIAGNSLKSVSIEAGINCGLLYQWVQKYKTMGYNGLINKKKGRKSKVKSMSEKTSIIPELSESEREELIRLRTENEYIKAENEIIKKEIALREENHAARLKAKKRR